MNLRRKLITKLPLAVLNASMTKMVLDQRVASLIRDLCDDLPALRNLRAGRVEDRREIRSTGLWLAIYLDETEQMAIQYPGDRYERSLLTDLFLQDVELVGRQQNALRQRISRALSPAMDPTGNEDIVIIRKRLKRARRDEGFLLPSGPETERVQYDDLPKVMPRGYKAEVRVRVNWINRKSAEVLILDAVDLKGASRDDLPRGTKIKLIREGTQKRPSSGLRLLEAMDQKRDLTLAVTVALNWVSGEPIFLELTDYVDDNELRKNGSLSA